MPLNPAQKAAVETLRGPLLVLAGAGTGKTRVVTFRIARLIRSGIASSRILAVTFTNKAAKEMQSRITEQLGSSHKGEKKEKPEISTFHSLCVRILRRNIHHLGYPNQFAIYDRGDQESIARQVLKDIRVSDTALKPGDLLRKIGQWKCSAIRPARAASEAWSAKDHIASLAYGRYQNALKALGAVDFDDLLLCTEDLFVGFPEVLTREASRFDHLLVDEYQDTNMSQYRIVKALASEHRNLCVVGDDDQAIYGWRGAEVSHILNFKKDWPDAKLVRLETNYRSTAQIVDWANRIIVFNKERHAKQLRCAIQGEPPRILQCKDGETEVKTVVSQIKTRLRETTRRPRDFAILFRTNEQTRAFEMELRTASIPYVLIGSQSFFDKKEIRDVIAYLKTIHRPQDEVSLLRIINTPHRGIGQSTIRKLTETAVAGRRSTWSMLEELKNEPNTGADDPDSPFASMTNKTKDALLGFHDLIVKLGVMLKKEFSVENLKEFLGMIQYQDEINRQFQKPEERASRWEAVGEIVNAAGEYVKEIEDAPDRRKPGLQEFLDKTSLAGPDFGSDGKKELGRNAVVLMTLHAAKGLEFPEVYMVGLEEGTLPHHRSVNSDDVLAVDEERRLCYVGITRAKRRLTLTLALSRMKWGKAGQTVPSRFLYELTGESENPNYQKVVSGVKSR